MVLFDSSPNPQKRGEKHEYYTTYQSFKGFPHLFMLNAVPKTQSNISKLDTWLKVWGNGFSLITKKKEHTHTLTLGRQL